MPLVMIFCFLLSGCYVIKQGYFQLKLLKDATPISHALRSPNLSLNERKKLELVTSIRQFAKEHIGLNTYNNYKNINLKWQYRLVNVSASSSLAFSAYEWWFPIIGKVPYKGFFIYEDALKESLKLKELGLEVQISQVAAYSSLGFFDDPLWPSMLEMPEHDLADLLFHEYTHATVYIKNDALFNESLASFVGQKATKLYYEHYYAKEIYEELLKNYEEDKLFRLFFHNLYQELNDLYQSSKTDTQKNYEKQLLKDKSYKEYQKQFPKSNLSWDKVNNAFLLSFKRYDNNLVIFEELLDILGGDWKKFFYEISTYSDEKQAFIGLQKRIDILRLKSL